MLISLPNSHNAAGNNKPGRTCWGLLGVCAINTVSILELATCVNGEIQIKLIEMDIGACYKEPFFTLC